MLATKTRGPFARKLPAALALLFLSACDLALPGSIGSALDQAAPEDVNFDEIAYFLERSDSAYDTPAEIRADYPNLAYAKLLPDVDVLYFIEDRNNGASQTISVRGTAGRLNVLEDLEIALIPDTILGIRIHKGFQEGAQAILDDAVPRLDKNKPIDVTGHSLGGAIAVVLAAYLDQNGYEIGRVVTFGQPRIASEPVSKDVLEVTTRVVNDTDVVPLVPPFTPITPYRHFGPEIVLRDGPDFVYLNSHDAERVALGEFWRQLSHLSLNDHHVAEYASKIAQKQQGAQQVPYIDAAAKDGL